MKKPKMAEQIEGKIYKIVNILDSDKFYIGGTSLSLSRRLSFHKSRSKERDSFFYEEVKRLGWNNFRIELIEDYPCDSKEDLRKEEDRFIKELNPYYNTLRAFLTEEERKENKAQIMTQYRKDHKEEISQIEAQYHKDHKEQISQRKSQYYRDKICKEVLNDIISKIELEANEICF